jgi:hypothetical protein
MRHLSSLKLAVLAAGIACSGVAVAQTAECQRYRAELASLGRSGHSAGAAQQQRIDIARLSDYYQSVGCYRGQFLFFGSPAPAECGAIAQRINTMQANYTRLASEADAYASDARRRQLMAAIQQVCNPAREAATEQTADGRLQIIGEDMSPRRLGGGRLVCVRACDGSFFPLDNLPASGRSDADDMCQALCPGAETAAYSIPRRADADIAQAVSLRGKSYTKLAGAFKFQKGFNPSCSCRKPDQSWAEALQKAEKMIERGSGDMIVTAKKAEELSRPKLARKEKPNGKAAPAATAVTALDVETTGSTSPAQPAAKLDDSAKAVEPMRAPAEPDSKRSIRMVGPTFISLPAQTEAR